MNRKVYYDVQIFFIFPPVVSHAMLFFLFLPPSVSLSLHNDNSLVWSLHAKARKEGRLVKKFDLQLTYQISCRLCCRLPLYRCMHGVTLDDWFLMLIYMAFLL